MSGSMENRRGASRQAGLAPPVTESCPYCGKSYQHHPLQEQPTCGDPNCVRAARKAGKPFAVIPRPRPPKPSKKPRQSRHKTP